jgi:hypothetical protein
MGCIVNTTCGPCGRRRVQRLNLRMQNRAFETYYSSSWPNFSRSDAHDYTVLATFGGRKILPMLNTAVDPEYDDPFL